MMRGPLSTKFADIHMIRLDNNLIMPALLFSNISKQYKTNAIFDDFHLSKRIATNVENEHSTI